MQAHYNPFEAISERLERLEFLVNEIKELSQNKPIPNINERLTRAEITARYKISLSTIHKMMRNGLPFEKCGRKTLFRLPDVEAHLAGQKRGGEHV